jgi:hypothetical protein
MYLQTDNTGDGVIRKDRRPTAFLSNRDVDMQEIQNNLKQAPKA